MIDPTRGRGVFAWGAALAVTPGLSPTPAAGASAGRPVGLTLLVGVAIVGALLWMMRRRFERADEIFDPRRPPGEPDDDDTAGPPPR